MAALQRLLSSACTGPTAAIQPESCQSPGESEVHGPSKSRAPFAFIWAPIA